MLIHAFVVFAVLLTLFLFFLILFERGLNYNVLAPPDKLDSPNFLRMLGALCDAQVHRGSRMQVFTNGEDFYAAELSAIRAAQRSINLEAYVFWNGKVAKQFIDAMTERARAGVKVKLVLDSFGSFLTPDWIFDALRSAGGQVMWYQPLRWYTFKRVNNRTHRELLVIDGRIGFIGGAGIGDVWTHDSRQPSSRRKPPWRDTVCRVTGPLVEALQTTFTENWLEAADEILVGQDYFPDDKSSEPQETYPHDTGGLVVISSPSAGRSTRVRVLYQTLLASAKKTVHVTSPYFVPDRSVREEMIRAVKERGVRVIVLAPNDQNNHPLARYASRRRYGQLLQGGVEIFEYQPAMIHAKVLVIDGTWAVLRSTNFDNRSFGLNDEVNLAALDPTLAQRLDADFQNDLKSARSISYEEWSHRPIYQRIFETLGRIIERQA
jgi:cardiolipin synthase A/B